MEELLKNLGITKEGQMGDDGSYVVDIDSYDEYGKMYSILEKASQEGKLDELEDRSIITVHTTDVAYVTPELQEDSQDSVYEICLLGDLDQDNYKIVVNKF